MGAESEYKTLAAVPYKRLAAECKVFNLNEFEYFLWVRLPANLSSSYYLYKIEEMKKDKLSLVDFPGAFMRENATWLKVNTNLINREIGQHTYKITFIDRMTNVEWPLYFTYIIQNDNPDKPYVYMKRDEATEVIK